ncbi:hypothetical protein [Oceaniglobus trochenteri]|uniref:hypothetical protein n=1 Tax=Oceaniglobus trochenteri TaxID=2763260 RepID=UPI001CFFC8A3|nr:hypothetical protein [Oceaniglobus trochenteri]
MAFRHSTEGRDTTTRILFRHQPGKGDVIEGQCSEIRRDSAVHRQVRAAASGYERSRGIMSAPRRSDLRAGL